MNRRGFLALFSSAVVGTALDHTLDLDRLLWIPGAKKIFLPPRITLVSATWITDDAVHLFENSLRFTNFVNRKYDAQFVGQTVGQTVNVRLPKRYAFRGVLPG